MSLVQGIQKMAQGDVAGGLVQSFTGSIGTSILEAARGNKSVGQAAAQIGTDVASAAISFIPGIGPVAGAALKAGMAAGNEAIQGGTIKDIAIAGVTSGVSGAAGSLLGKASSAIKESVSKIKVGSQGVPTGAAADITTQSATSATAKAPVPSGAPELRPPTLRPAAEMTKAQVTGAKIIKGGKTVANSKAGKIAGQFGVQGALSVGSAIMGAKQANAANEVSRQSLLFQKQTYNEQQAEIEKNKAQRRADALTDYNAASLFGSQLYGSESNNTLLTNYHTNNGTGNQGSFSLLNASISTSKRTDLT
jgi:hypothetical protein